MVQFNMLVVPGRPIFVELICFKAYYICHHNIADTITVWFICLQITVCSKWHKYYIAYAKLCTH